RTYPPPRRFSGIQGMIPRAPEPYTLSPAYTDIISRSRDSWQSVQARTDGCHARPPALGRTYSSRTLIVRRTSHPNTRCHESRRKWAMSSKAHRPLVTSSLDPVVSCDDGGGGSPRP